MAVEFRLDASEMEPPEPFEKATEILRQLKPGQYLRMLHRRIPYPLFAFCKELSLDYAVDDSPAEIYQIIVYFPEDAHILAGEGVLCG